VHARSCTNNFLCPVILLAVVGEDGRLSLRLVPDLLKAVALSYGVHTLVESETVLVKVSLLI